MMEIPNGLPVAEGLQTLLMGVGLYVVRAVTKAINESALTIRSAIYSESAKAREETRQDGEKTREALLAFEREVHRR